MNTDYRTFMIGFTNTDSKRIFQSSTELKKIIEVAEIQGHIIDIDATKELNQFQRFVKIKRTPTWLAMLLGRHITNKIMTKNDMI